MGLFLNSNEKRKTFAGGRTGLISSASYVVIDAELTGLNERKDSIVSLGAVRMKGGRISLGDVFYRLVKPETALTRDSIVIHGIMPSEVAEEEEIGTVLTEFISFCGDAILVGHCVYIDLAFLDREMKRVLGFSGFENVMVDTAQLYTWMAGRRMNQPCFTRRPRHPYLYELAGCLEIPVAEAHHALQDAFITAQLFQRFLPLLQEEGIKTIGDLARIGDPFGGGDRFRSTGEFHNF